MCWADEASFGRRLRDGVRERYGLEVMHPSELGRPIVESTTRIRWYSPGGQVVQSSDHRERASGVVREGSAVLRGRGEPSEGLYPLTVFDFGDELWK
jgi:hypothetical protein